ncbi:TRAP transporter substrate-binding protein [Oceaniglobus indicus]|uniref:TRAP transporter substrate-binding protein n=1 Tax=Oceaniglobus indicus TaxID=2047749 RepID=UPI000C18C853|nr:TRAP transporter substrate-binding protein [Oceaniglobus indicus]
MKLTATLLTATALCAATAAQAEVWDMPLAYSATNFHSENAARFGDCVTKGTDGAIEIKTHPSGSLFGGADIKRAIQTGQVQIGERLMSAHANENPLFAVDSVPFLATSFEDSAKLFEAARPKLEEALGEQNLTLLYAVPWPPQGLYFDKAVESVADMEGIKFRSYNTTTARFAELTKMLPVSIEAAELQQAFATGVAESMISSGATGYDQKVWENLSHFYTVDAWLPYNYVMVNSDIWAETAEDAKAVISDCAEQAAANGLEASKNYTQLTLEGLREGGMTVAPPSETLKADLDAIGETMTAEWLEEAGEAGQAVVDAYRGAN